MTASAATLTAEGLGHLGGFKVKTGTCTLATNAEDGVTIALGWSRVDHVSLTLVSASPVQSGLSYSYSSGTLTLYGAAASNLLDGATVSFVIFGAD